MRLNFEHKESREGASQRPLRENEIGLTTTTPSILRPVVPRKQSFVQTQRETHVKWGRLAVEKPMAAAVLHQLVALMDRQNAIAVGQRTLSRLIGVHETTVKRALKHLRENKWIQQVQLGLNGTVNVYVINDRVAWADYRENLRLSKFSAVIIADAADQSEITLSIGDLQKVPIIHPPEDALPAGEYPNGETVYLDGLEPVIEAEPHQLENFSDD